MEEWYNYSSMYVYNGIEYYMWINESSNTRILTLTNTFDFSGGSINIDYIDYMDDVWIVDGDGETISAMAAAGKGVIWQMVDEWNNDLPYDFKNAQFYRAAADVSYIDADGYYYTFAYLYDGDFVDFSVRGNYDLTDDDYGAKGVYCHNNKIGLYQKHNGTNYLLALNNIVIYNNQEYFNQGIKSNLIGLNCYDNTIADFFYYNTIKDNFYSNTIGNTFYSNTIGNNFNENTIENGFHSNTIENGFNSNTIGNMFNNNTIGNSFGYNTIGNEFHANTIGNKFHSNTIGNTFYPNTIGNEFQGNTIGNIFNNNTIGNKLFKTIFGDNCQYNTISNRINGTTTNKTITFGDSITMCTIQDFAFGVLAANLDDITI
jgi:hypothetical protein